MSASANSSSTIPKNSWRELPNQKNIAPQNGAFYYEFALSNGSTAHLVVAYTKTGKWRVKPIILDKTTPTSEVGSQQSASAAINGGFFNLSNGASASYVVIDGKTVADPHDNKALMDNIKLKDFLPQIFNRSELRILKKPDGKSTEFQICKHQDPLPTGMVLLDSLQAGPALLPTLDDADEAFIRKQADGTVADSISCKKPAARTAFGITRDGYALFLCVSGKGQDKESSGINLEELADLMKRLGCRQAINLDGGSSTSMYINLAGNSATGRSVCAKDPETRVKTVLMLMPQ